MILHFMQYQPVNQNEVATELWPFVLHLNILARRGVFYRRAFRQIHWTESDFERGYQRLASMDEGQRALDELRATRLQTAATGEPRALFARQGPLPEKGPIDWAVNQQMLDFFAESTGLQRSLASALRCIAPELVAERVRTVQAAAEVSGIYVASSFFFSEHSEEAGAASSPISSFLDHLTDIEQTLTRWDVWLDLLQDGTVVQLWRGYEQRERAKRSGELSGVSRRQTARVSEQAVRDAAQQLLELGRSKREVAGILAQRFSVSPDYIRKLWKRSERSGRFNRD